jgi:hypothetical protein
MDDGKRMYALSHVSCEQCKGRLTNTLSKEQEEELTNSVISALKKYPISYTEAYRVLDCVSHKLFAMADNLQL